MSQTRGISRVNGGELIDGFPSTVALCHSCDRCRSRKTKCDGNRPCSGCAAKFMKKNKVDSIEGVPLEAFECVYSPAKRRGPVPGKQAQARKASEAFGQDVGSMIQQPQQPLDDAGLRQLVLAQQAQALQSSIGLDQSGWTGSASGSSRVFDSVAGSAAGIQQQMNLLDQLNPQQPENRDVEPTRQRMKMESFGEADKKSHADTVTAHIHMLSRSSTEGNRLRAYFRLSIDELFTFPTVPSDDEYCVTANIASPQLIPKTHKQALMAARFSELALGALVHNEVPLAMELCNATVHCLRESVVEPVQNSYLFEICRAYFLLGTFRAFRGDMVRYFKYRRVCMTHLSRVSSDHSQEPAGQDMLLAAMSFLDSWAYMVYNANEKELPDIDDMFPHKTCGSSDADRSSKPPACAISDPNNKMWIQGAPPVYLNNEAPLAARSLDALACAVRQCCDQANSRFLDIAKETNTDISTEEYIPQDSIVTPTKTAVMANENELCSRNMVLSAFTLLQQHEALNSSPEKNQGHHLIISAMDAFLENGQEDGTGGFTDSQIQSLLSVCNIVIENPYLLYHAGPTYHMVSNAAVLICHLLNGMHAMDQSHQNGDMEVAVFDEILDTFLSVRKLLNVHRRKLPVKLRCHGIPRPNLFARQGDSSKPLIDLGETLMCFCRGCQGFVLMACSPCVAAERALAVKKKQEAEMAQESQDLDQDLYDFESEFDLDDDALLNMLSRIISS